jgi:hypothetical protein
LQLRPIERWLLPAALFAGILLPSGSITGDTGRMLATFLGMVSASILPTISLLINSMTASGRSVLALNELEAELQAAMDALFLLFGSSAVVVGALVALATPAPEIFAAAPYLATDVLPRLGQGIVSLFSVLTLLRVGQIPGILRRTLAARHRIAVDEARRTTLENASEAAAKTSFATHPDFGKQISLEEAQSRDPH